MLGVCAELRFHAIVWSDWTGTEPADMPQVLPPYGTVICQFAICPSAVMSNATVGLLPSQWPALGVVDVDPPWPPNTTSPQAATQTTTIRATAPSPTRSDLRRPEANAAYPGVY